MHLPTKACQPFGLTSTTAASFCRHRDFIHRSRPIGAAVFLSATLPIFSSEQHCAMAGSIRWMENTADCYDAGVHQKKPIVILFYDKTNSRIDGDAASIRISLSPSLQSSIQKAVWCFADVSNEGVARNFGKALGIDVYPTVSVLAPHGDEILENTRTEGFLTMRGKVGDDGATAYIARGIEEISAKIPR